MTDEQYEDSMFGGDIVAFVQCLLGDEKGESQEPSQETKASLLQAACKEEGGAPKGQKRKRLKATQAWHGLGQCACCE